MQITSPDELLYALKIAINGSFDERNEAIQAIATYKWYNYYQNIHIKVGSDYDFLNEQIFDMLQKDNNSLHNQIENVINGYIERLNNNFD